jgi:hypothetical protein
MSAPVAEETAHCPACEAVLEIVAADCPQCHAPADWVEALLAQDYIAQRLTQWQDQRRIRSGQYSAMIGELHAKRGAGLEAARAGKTVPAELALTPPLGICVSCQAPLPPGSNRVAGGPDRCPHCNAAANTAAARFFRHLCGLERQLERWQEQNRLSPVQVQSLAAEVKSQRIFVKRQIDQDRAANLAATQNGDVNATQTIKGPPPVPPRLAGTGFARREPRRSLWEMLLDPRTIQWLLALGGAMFVVGLIVWLAVQGLFTPRVIAVGMGVANLALLAGGAHMVRNTRYQMAGRAITLLACFVMPLNLWYYHAHDLITIEQRLWIPALVCCVLYAAVAVVLRDPSFVYVLMGGIALTGALLLGDMNKFWEITAPSLTLVLLGLIGIHVHRAFPRQDEGPFNRRRFGMAFFWSGQALLAGGLLLLLGAQIAGGWLYEPFFRPIYSYFGSVQPLVVTQYADRLIALALVVAAAYAYLYSDFAVRRVGVYVYLAAFTTLWAEVLLIDLVHDQIRPEVIIAILALTALAANLIERPAESRGSAFARTMPPLGLLLSCVPVLFGIVLHIRATCAYVPEVWRFTPGWPYVGAMLLTAGVCRLGAHLHRHSHPRLSTTYFFATAAATMVAAAAFLTVPPLALRAWDQQAPWLMLLPIAYVVASRSYRGHTAEKPLYWVAHAATAVIALGAVGATLTMTERQVLDTFDGNPRLAAAFALAAVFYILSVLFHRHEANVFGAALAGCGAMWQVLSYWNVQAEFYTLAFAVAGLVMLIAFRLADAGGATNNQLAEAAFGCANALMSLSFIAAALITLSRFAADRTSWQLVMLLCGLTVIALIAVVLVRDPMWRRWYIVAAIGEGLLAFITLEILADLQYYQKIEVFCLAVGIAMLIAAHIGWYREQDTDDELVSAGLWLGGVLAVLPMTIDVLSHRGSGLFTAWNLFTEIALLAVAVGLLVTGLMFQLKATTVVGGIGAGAYVLSLLLLIRLPDRLQTTSVILTAAGACVFATGLLLSLYRDRLLELPDRIKRREGVFRVLSWR